MKNFDKNQFLKKINNKQTNQTISKIVDGLISIENREKDCFTTDFLSLLEYRYVLDIINSFEVEYDDIFSSDEYERKLLVIYNKKYDLKDFLQVVRINDFKELEHRNILGYILSLGINRSKIGDIIKLDDFWYIYFLKPIGEFVFLNGVNILNHDIDVCVMNDIFIPENFKKYSNFTVTVSSMRLDCIVKEVVNTSREKSQQLIKDKQVKINYFECNIVDKKVMEKDIISVRKFGKFILESIIGKSRKGKYILQFKRYEK